MPRPAHRAPRSARAREILRPAPDAARFPAQLLVAETDEEGNERIVLRHLGPTIAEHAAALRARPDSATPAVAFIGLGNLGEAAA